MTPTNLISVTACSGRPDDHAAFRDVLSDLREADRFEFACAGVSVIEVGNMASGLLARDAYTFNIDDEPVFVWGIVNHNGIATLWGFGTPRTRRVIPAATRFGKRWWLPKVFEEGAVRRIEVRVPLKSQHSISWLRKLGMTVESWDVQHHSVNGEQAVQLAYTTREYTRDYVHVQQQIERERSPSSRYAGPGEDFSGSAERDRADAA